MSHAIFLKPTEQCWFVDQYYYYFISQAIKFISLNIHINIISKYSVILRSEYYNKIKNVSKLIIGVGSLRVSCIECFGF